MKRILLPSAVATAVCMLTAAMPAYAQPAAHPAHTATAGTVATSAAVKRYELHTNIVDGKMVFVDNKGQVNPVLAANTGDTIEVVLESGEGAEHDMRLLRIPRGPAPRQTLAWQGLPVPAAHRNAAAGR